MLFDRFIVLRFENANISNKISIFGLFSSLWGALFSHTWHWFELLLLFFLKCLIFPLDTILTAYSFSILIFIHQFLTFFLVWIENSSCYVTLLFTLILPIPFMIFHRIRAILSENNSTLPYFWFNLYNPCILSKIYWSFYVTIRFIVFFFFLIWISLQQVQVHFIINI